MWVLNLMDWDDPALADTDLCRDPDQKAKKAREGRQAKRKEFAESFCGPWWSLRSKDFWHYCPPGCCQSQEEAVKKVMALMLACWLGILPPVPAANRWSV